MDTNSSIEGYLFCIAPVRQGGGGSQFIQTFCVLSGRQFSQWRHKGDLVPLRSGVLDLDYHVEDTGRQIVDTKILYTIRLYSIMDLTKEVLMGAESAEEIAEWFKAFTCSLGKPLEIRPDTWPTSASIQIGCFTEPLWGGSSPTAMDVESPLIQRQKTRSYNSLVTIGPETPLLSKDFSNGGTADLQSVSPGVVPKWSLVRCENGLRFFEETSDFLFRYKLPVTKAVGVVKAPADQIFNLIMDYGLERHQWDHTFRSASIVETVDGHSDVLYLCLRQDWIWRRPRDFCLSRYWKREDNGTYSVFYRSVSKMPLQPGYVRAYIRSGGYIVTPLKSGASGKPRTLVEFVLEMNVAGWSSLFGIGLCTYPVHLRNSLLSVVAGIREYVAAQRVNSSLTIVRRHSMEYMDNHMQQGNSNTGETFVVNIPFLDNEELDEFHDANMDQLSEWSETMSETYSIHIESSKSPKIATPTRAACPQHGMFDMPYFRGSVPRGPLDGGQHCFSEPEGSNFLVKGSNFFHTGSRVAAGEPLCKLVAVDWLKGKDRMNHVAGHPHSLVQKASFNGELYFFVINLQVSYTLNYSLVFYFVTNEEILEGSLLHRFIFGDDTFRNSRLSLIPAIPEGSWIIKQAVGSRAVPLGQIVDASYHVGFNYIEIDLNLGSSGVVRGVMGLVFGYISALVVDMAFFIRCDVEEELPERLIGVGRLARLQMDKAVPPLAGI